MKTKKEKLPIVALMTAASIALTGASGGVNPTNQKTDSPSINLSVDQNNYNLTGILNNDLAIMRISKYLLSQIKDLDSEDEKVNRVIELYKKINQYIEEKDHSHLTLEEHYKSNNDGTHTIEIKYVCLDTNEVRTETKTVKCTLKNKGSYLECVKCDYTKDKANYDDNTNDNSHIHNLVKTSEEYRPKDDKTHEIITTYKCTSDNETQIKTSTGAHAFSEWKPSEDNKELTSNCLKCGYEITKENIETEHKHSTPPSDLQYTITEPNGDGTHKLKGTYTCTECKEEVELEKNENCDYITESYEIFSEYNSYNYHDRVDTCQTCGYENKVREECTKTGEIKYIKIGAYIYEYYNCEFCKGYVDRFEHTKHNFGQWEYNPDYHIRYCGCVEGREKGEHQYSFTEDPTNEHMQIATCDICNYTKQVLDHEHAKDGMGLTELLGSSFYDELISKSQFANPDPSPDDYCSRYDLKCKTCGMDYSIYYGHNFVDGVCTRKGYCGGITDPNYTSKSIEHERTENTYSLEETTNVLKLTKAI